MKKSRAGALCAILSLTTCVWSIAHGQEAQTTPIESRIATPVNEEFPVVPSRIVGQIDETRLARLTGNTHPLARAQNDKGSVEPQLLMERMQLLLKRSPEQEAALQKHWNELYDQKSPLYHHWLTPEEYGKLYGPSDADINQITSWLENHGFQIYQVTPGRTHIEFTGTAEQVERAFHTEMHNYLVNGVHHIANNADPQIPEALTPVVAGVASLHNFFPKHQSVLGHHVKINHKTGKVTEVEETRHTLPNGVKPQFGFTDDGGNTEEDITPFDFAAIYNLTPLWNAGIKGKGVNIAISAVTDIYQADINAFRSSFGLPASTINVIHNGADPGVDTGSLTENTLDTEWSGAAAPEATVNLVISKSTSTAFGGDLSNTYIVNHPAIAATFSASYGECEAFLGTTGNASLNETYKQGSMVGISMFESSGDQGSTGCDNSDAAAPNPAQNGLQVNGSASSPYITGVGGTDFAWPIFTSQAAFWKTSDAANGSNAVGYIPEIPWNGTCASNYLQDFLFASNVQADTTAEASCNDSTWADFLKVTGGSGGKSSCTTIPSDATSFSQCTGHYAKPTWQTGTGVPADGARDVPDVSLFASSGYPDGVLGSAYLICVSSNTKGFTCQQDYANPDEIVYQSVGGTSVSSPAMAGIMALVVQKVGSNQGLVNPVLYQLFAKETLANCNSFAVKNGNACVFYDISNAVDGSTTYVWNNAQPCTTGRIDCVTKNSGDAYGIVSGYNSAKGYDYATGLGSVNAANLANAWPTGSTGGGGTLKATPATIAFVKTVKGTESVAVPVTIKNGGTSAVTLKTISFTGTNPTSFVELNACPASLAASASCIVYVAFKPASAAALKASLSIADTATGSPQVVTLTGTGTAADTVKLSVATLAFGSVAKGTQSPAKSVTVTNTGGTILDITGITITGAGATSYLEATTCGPTLAAAANCVIDVAFKPTAAGSLPATLSIADSGGASPQKVALSGTGH